MSGVQSVLVTEFLGGGDLCERTSARDYILTEQKCRTIIRQIVQGVKYMHEKEFIHLDLKPFNIVFAQKMDDYNLKIIDFGLARMLPEGTKKILLKCFCGTIEYMSPEVMDCTEVGKAADC